MSKRTLRRAAERQARKEERKLQVTAQLAAAIPDQNHFFQTAQAEVTVEPTPLLAEPILALEPAVAVEHRPATLAQIAANRENSKLSTGPQSPEGKAAVAQNRRSHGLAGRFTVLPWENAEDFQILAQSIYAEHSPETDTEQRLADCLIQHYWLTQRAIRMQEDLIAKAGDPVEVDSKKLSLFLRYQTTHERSYYKAERELQNLRKQKRKDEIGFESQKARQESQDAQLRLTHARAANLEIDTAARQIMEAPLPGNYRISFEELTKACSNAISNVVFQNQLKLERSQAAAGK